MKRQLVVVVFILIAVTFVYASSFQNFFTQDDFILINYFSQNNLSTNLSHIVAYPSISHWRPIHNLFFFITGSIFGKNLFAFHLIIFAVQIFGAFFIYRTCLKLIKNFSASILASVLYVASPAHFVTYFWISGGATAIGFLFLISSFYYYLENRKKMSIPLFVISFLASEAMIVGPFVFLIYMLIFKPNRYSRPKGSGSLVFAQDSLRLRLNRGFFAQNKLQWAKARGIFFFARFGSHPWFKSQGFPAQNKTKDKFILFFFLLATIFSFVRFFFLTPNETFNAYKITFGPSVIGAIKFYLLRILGFAEGFGRTFNSAILIGLFVYLGYRIRARFKYKNDQKLILFSLAVIILGLLPFVLITNHLSANYMNISLFGFAIMVAVALKDLNQRYFIALTLLFLIVYSTSVKQIRTNNWVVNRSNIAKTYIGEIEANNPSSGSVLVFDNNRVSTSFDAYVALGAGEAINFWFKDRNYSTCFTFYRTCLFPKRREFLVR